MAMHRQASAVLVVCQIKKLLKELGIKDTDKEVKARVVVGIRANRATFFSPRLGRSSSSVAVSLQGSPD